MCLANGVIAAAVVQRQCQADAVLIRIALCVTVHVTDEEAVPIEGNRFRRCDSTGITRRDGLIRRSNVPDGPPGNIGETGDVDTSADARAPTWDSGDEADDDMPITYVDSQGRGIRLV